MRPTRVEIDLDSIAYNIHQIRKKVGNKTKIMAVMKANAYGHGAVEVAKVAIDAGAQWLAVALVEEAIQLREAGIQSPILILGSTPPDQVHEVIKYNLSQTVCSRELIETLSNEAQSWNQTAKVHIKVDTGLGRLGIFPEEVAAFVKESSCLEGIEIEGIFTHFSVADEDKAFTELQIKKFKEVISNLEREKIHIPLKHAANSAAVVGFASSYFNLVRPGIILYGLYPSPEMNRTIPLKPAMSFKTKITYLKRVPAGYSLSYDRTFTTKRKSLIAILPVGYADGYPRALSNKGEVLIKGKRAPVVGMICMDMTLVDVTHIPDVKVGDEVVLFGKQNGAQISADEIASKSDLINYEILCGISKRVPRIYKRRDGGNK
ncbi:alanine racemase [Candidatus Aerophobetes bacterium]|uniref:Alanine racemase n=1 Tax=Aerophobetes bacterium TaxID=2030807 RepID=A0A662DKU8_UNCAE|nr:MAG: alanine racemase [Candidatus Aerophobetes bacterium]